eukprot:m.46146 g.46146  ORF g.46146 m.46146 type:complete len:433 (-) comp6726_c0_seq1:1610-2908(-)
MMARCPWSAVALAVCVALLQGTSTMAVALDRPRSRRSASPATDESLHASGDGQDESTTHHHTPPSNGDSTPEGDAMGSSWPTVDISDYDEGEDKDKEEDPDHEAHSPSHGSHRNHHNDTHDKPNNDPSIDPPEPSVRMTMATVVVVAIVSFFLTALVILLTFQIGHSRILDFLQPVTREPHRNGPSAEEVARMKEAVKDFIEVELPLTPYGGALDFIDEASEGATNREDVDEDDCAICLETFALREAVRQLKCGHFFHPVCIDPWLLQNNPRCPLCKDNVLAYTSYRPMTSNTGSSQNETAMHGNGLTTDTVGGPDDSFDSFNDTGPLLDPTMYEDEDESLEMVDMVSATTTSRPLHLMQSPCENDSDDDRHDTRLDVVHNVNTIMVSRTLDCATLHDVAMLVHESSTDPSLAMAAASSVRPSPSPDSDCYE